MKRIATLLLCLVQTSLVFGQQSGPQNTDKLSEYFREIKNATGKESKLWNKDLYGGILLVDTKSRQVYSNESDAKNSLTPHQDIYTGTLPGNINIANTSVQWNGKTWAMIMLPLSNDKYDRINLLAHELFHTVQSSLGFPQGNKESNHLDQKDGRVYLRLELEALEKAVLSDSQKEQRKHLTNALMFRKYRNILFPGSNETENQLELNEGLAEYTGFVISGRNKEQTKQHFTDNINSFLKNPTYVRSFAYNTTPVYGYLLSQKDKYWNQKITANSNLTDVFIKALNIKIPADVKAAVEKISPEYDGASIIKEEQIREEKIKIRIAEYKAKLIEQPHLEIRFEKMNVSFDPRNILPIEDKGTVYPNIRVTDNWGILEVKNGALMYPNWDRMSISIPSKINDQLVEGDGWTLQLNSNYTVKKDEKGNNYILIKK
ncbi:hypothetical protein ATB99_16350 [Elizabethkingia meningoseptica]|uniref:hypothetical protein n=1 Tax=Elizabethkingia meningoseptica TaxID=238 RepID=UPI000332CCBB|nr:hypothetical protein [Elizabethkingia meningoseptica]AQX06119.1 hypothetical protein BBD33_13035 [Elizabethkingia meningoseptica]AQX48165.1 hypothetical protein B5G46_13025 [Elizabethkingia meningoseptica]EOR30228.1 hypothetical protein L100_07069 [Elizabethkingia meningoseptica ATCC 13253 = NBRC 12535]KUY23352.1 hypothetical protein ATB99_16350 [Elizabethkingia meningoseptica]OPB71500.1 hypothetical protein BAY30_02705 [Elizabethkingia meningoseptica]